jgi:hypothetical protein
MNQPVLLEGVHDQLATAAERRAVQRASAHRRGRVAAFAVTGALGLGGAAAVAQTIWAPQLGDDRRGHPTASASSPPAGQLAVLGVLRRPATAADHGAQSTYALRLMDPSLEGIRTAYVRLLGTQSGGDLGFVLVPVASYGSPDGTGSKPDALCLFSRDTDGGGLGCFTTAELLAGAAVMEMYEPAPARPEAAPPTAAGLGAASTTAAGLEAASPTAGYERVRGAVNLAGSRVFGLVPDGVASVRVTNDLGSVTAAVTDNFFEAPIPSGTANPSGPFAAGDQPTVVWLDGSGGEVAQAAAPAKRGS